MAARAKTLLELRTRIRKLADCVGDTTTGRHTTSELNVMINASWQAMRQKVCQSGARLYLTVATGTFSVGPATGKAWGEIAFPASAASVYGIDVTVTATDIRSLHPGSFLQRNEWFGPFGQNNGIPTEFDIFNVGTEATTAVTAGTIGIMPASDSAYAYAVWYLPSWTDLTTDTHVFNGLEGWEDWVVYNCVVDLAMADNDMANTFAIANTQRDAAEKRMVADANKVQRAGPIRRIDTAGMRQRDAVDSRWWPGR